MLYLHEPIEASGQGGGGGGVLLNRHKERERKSKTHHLSGVVSVSLSRCSALWERVEEQCCCHGDKLQRSVLEVGSN